MKNIYNIASSSLSAVMLLLGLVFTMSAMTSCQSSDQGNDDDSLAVDSIV